MKMTKMKMKMPKNMWVCFFVLVVFFAFIWMYTSSMKEGFNTVYTASDKKSLDGIIRNWINDQAKMGTPVNLDTQKRINTLFNQMKQDANKTDDKNKNNSRYNEINSLSNGGVSA